MKPTILLALLLTIISAAAGAQDERSPFRKKYIRFGIQNLGNETPDHSLKPADNMIKGNLGAGMGGVFEAGRHFYFIGAEKAKLLNAGIDWTIFSFTLNPSGKSWKHYAENVAGYSANEFTSQVALSVASKIGPVVSINPVQDMVIDVRVQAAFNAYVLGPVYESYENENDADPKNAFFPSKNDTEATGIKMYTGMFATSIRPNIGATVRWRTIGIALDYAPGKIKMNYNRTDNGTETNGTAQVPANSMQAKLSLVF